MKKQRLISIPSNVQTLLGFICVTGGGLSANAQCTQQPPEGTFSVPPKHVVYYQLDSSLSGIPAGSASQTPTSQIIEAFNAWSAANSGSGGDGVTFAPSDASNPPSVIVLATTTQNLKGNVADTSTPNGVINSNSPAIITIYQNEVLPSGSPAYSASSTGYSTAFLQVALHEIGHLQGLGDYPQGSVPPLGPQSSVMQPYYGTNDAGNAYQKTAPTPCDVAQAAKDSAAIALGGGSSGSGSAGDTGTGTVGGSSGGGIGITPCGTSCTWDDQTNTLTCDLCSS